MPRIVYEKPADFARRDPSVLTLGVADLEPSLEFLRDGLGLPTEGMPCKVVHGASDVAVGQRGYS